MNLGTFFDIIQKKEKRGIIKFGIGGVRKTPRSYPFSNSIEYGYSASIDSKGLIEHSFDMQSGSIELSGKTKSLSS